MLRTTQGDVFDSSCLQAADLSNHVEALLMAVKSTNDFEAEMSQKFGGKQASAKEDDSVSFSFIQLLCND